MILSIIVPIYKVEKYIKHCLSSIIGQINNKEIELILVNDGTPDKSMEIARTMVVDMPNVIIIEQINQGLSLARNHGLDKASGDFVWFIDSDDSIEDSCIDGIIKVLLKENPDLMHINYRKVYENNTESHQYISRYKGIQSGREIISKGGLTPPAQFSIYKRKFLIDNSLYFVPGILHEDSEFKPRATYLAKKIYFYSPVVYNYLQRTSGNIMSSFKYKNAYDIIWGINNLIKFSKTHGFNKQEIRGLRKIIGMNYNTILYGLKKMDQSDYRQTISLLRENKNILRELIGASRLKYKMEGLILILNINMGVYFYSLFKIN